MLDRSSKTGGPVVLPVESPAPAASAEPASDFPSLHSEPVAAEPTAEAIASRIAAFERESRARGGDAALHHEIGRLWESWQKSPRNAAIAYQNAYREDPRHLPTLKAARRLFAEVGNWQMVAQLLEAEAEAATDEARRAALIFERGLVVEERLGKSEEALGLYRRALELAPNCLPALLHVASLEASTPEALATTLEQLAASLADAPLRCRALATAAALREDRLGDTAAAGRLWAEAFAADPSDRTAATRYALHLERLGAAEPLAAVLGAQARAEGAAGAAAAYRLGKLLVRLDREEEAIAALLEARRLSPADPLVLGELARIFEARQAWQELAGVLEASAAAATDEAERIALHLALGTLYEERLEDREKAIASLRAILALEPHHGSALAGLGKLYHQAGDWSGLLATFEAEAAGADDPRQRAVRLYKAALLLEEKLDSADEAIVRHEAILQLVPGYLPAVQALARLFAARGRWAELVAMLDQELEGASDRDHRLDTLARIASVQETRLLDLGAAIATHRRMLAIAPEHLPTIRSLARLAEEAGAWADLVYALDREAARTGDQRQVIGLLHRNAELLEERLGNRDGAVEVWQRVLTLAPNYLPALRAMGRIYARQGRWEELVAMHRHEAACTADKRAAAAILGKVAALFEQEVCDENRALATWREVLALDPTHLPALQRLARIHQARADWESLVGVLREEALARTAPAERAPVFCRIAEILEERLGRTDAARDAWQEALRLQPDSLVALQALERIHAQAGAWRELASVYERQLSVGSPAARAAAYALLAQLYLDRLAEPARAAQCCEAALALVPDHLSSLHLLERIRTLQGDRHRRAELRSRLAEATSQPEAQVALILAAHADRERLDGNTAAAELLRAVELQPRDDRAFEALERALRRADDPAGLAAALRTRAASERDTGLHIALLHRLASIRERELGDPAGALEALDEALALDPGHLPVLADQERLLRARGAWTRLRENLHAQGAALRDPGLAAAALVRAGEVAHLHLRDENALEADLRLVLARDPTEPRAGRMLEELLAARGGTEELARLHEQRAAGATNTTDAAAGWVAAARLRHEDLQQPEAALDLLERALQAAPGHREALERRGRIHRELGQWREAVRALSARIQLGGDGRSLSPIHFQLGVLHADHLGDVDRAIGHLQAAVGGDPDHVEALRLLARLHLAGRDFEGALEPLRRLLEREQDPHARARLHADLAGVLEEGFGDLAGAAATIEEQLAIQPDDEAAWERLTSLYERVRDLPRLVETLERRAALAAGPLAASLLHKAAGIRAVPLRDGAGAVALWEQAIALDPACAEARLALAEHAATDAALGATALEQHRWLLERDPLRASSWSLLLQRWREAGAYDRAFHAAAVLSLLGLLEGEERRWYNARREKLACRTGLPESIRASLLPAAARGPLGELASAIGGELGKVLPPQLDRWGVGRSERLRADSDLRLAFESQLRGLGGDSATCELYGSPQPGVLAVEASDPQAVILGADLAAAPPRTQAFLLGRLAWQMAQGDAFVHRLPAAESAAILGAAVQLHEPHFEGLGPVDEGLARRLAKALSRRTRRAIEPIARTIAAEPSPWDAAAFVDAVRHGADRAALLLAADPELAFEQVLREVSPQLALEDHAAVRAALEETPRALELLRWALSAEHLALRQQLGSAVAG
ncbi:tetratricopeptide repeat protein [Vulgatibacter sp.]|uniref:tetratricopeptide repeat protein n=1 Tax=Vulgatibacter sp. TaxID=1971226 RepID=UPI00356AB99A